MDWNPTLYNDRHSFVYAYGESLVALLAPQPHERILDLGCGTGELTQNIHEKCGSVIGMDKSLEMVHKARVNFPHIEFRQGNAAQFAFDTPFDAIFSNATLHWVHPPKEAIKCMYGALKKGGRMVVEFGGKGNVGRIVQELVFVLEQRGHGNRKALNPWYFPTIGEYASELENEGFRVLSARHYDRPTELVDSQSGIIDWIIMFGSAFMEGLETKEMKTVAAGVQSRVKEDLFHDGKWYADYKRIRVVAKKA